MAQYRVISSLMPAFKQGDLVSDDDLAGLNVAALIEGGHLDTVQTAAKQTKQDDAKDK
jgi:hypothetical protein